MKETLLYAGRSIEYNIIKRSRKTVGITIDRENGVRVLAPFWANKAQIKEVIENKASWISKKLLTIEETREKEKARRFEEGESFYLLGKPYMLVIRHEPGCRPAVTLDKGCMILSLPQAIPDGDTVRGLLLKWYYSAAGKIIGERVQHYSGKLNASPSKISIREQKTRWGSCSKDNRLSFNWKIVTAPLEILDYLVIHELSHIKEKNHSSRYWEVVGSILPRYKECDRWLRLNGSTLGF